MLINTGRFSISVTGSDRLTCLLPSTWSKYIQESSSVQNTFLLHLEEGIHQAEDKLPDGWNMLRVDGNTHVQYTLHGKAVFELQYCFPVRKNEVIVRVRKALDSYIRLGAHYGMMLLLYRECIGLHGVTLLCEDEIIILSAPSGTGKTTLSRLLEKYGDSITINGDFALLSVSEEGVIFEPTPFCGTSRRSLNHRVRVDRVVFLEQDKTNLWQVLTGREALIRFISNAFIPSWDHEVENTILDNLMKCISCLKVNAFAFAPAKEAAEVFLKNIKATI